jgi:hypothetical protein
MSSVTLYRASGLALLLGSVLAIIGAILIFVFPSGTLALVLTGVAVSGVALVALGTPGIAARQASRAGWLGFAGFLLLSLSWLLLVGFMAMLSLTIAPWLVVHAPQVGAQLFSTNAALSVYVNMHLVLLVLGGVLLGIATMRAGVFSRWAGLLLIVGAVLSPAGFVIGIVGEVGTVLVFLGLGWMGYALLTAQGEAEAVPQPVLAS